MNNMLVIGTSPGRSNWVNDCSGSISIPHIIVSWGGYELGQIKWVLDNTNIDRFIFIQDTMVIRDLAMLVSAFETEGSSCLQCNPGFCFARYLGLYERKTLAQVEIPDVKTKGDSIHFESRWPRTYMDACEILSHPHKDLVSTVLYKPILKHGRENIVVVNQLYEKYQADWGQNHHPTSF